MNSHISGQDHAPVAIFVYNRADHTKQTIEALAKNTYAPETILYVFADAAKSPDDLEQVCLVRDYIQQIRGFQQIIVKEQDINQGLAKSIIEGVTYVLDRHERAIVLEDDIVTSENFLKFMNDALRYYENVHEVMHISGCNYPVGELSLDDQETYFLRVPLCWGWATWKNRWQLFKRDPAILNNFNRAMVRDINFDGTATYWDQMKLNHSGKISTWFIFWYASLYLNRGLSLFPRYSLVNNIGHDGSGVHCSPTDDYSVQLHKHPIRVSNIPLKESPIAYEAHKIYFKGLRISFFTRVARKLGRLFKKMISIQYHH